MANNGNGSVQQQIQRIVAAQRPKAMSEMLARERAKRNAVNETLAQLVDAGLFDHLLAPPPAQVEGGIYAPDEIDQAEQIAQAIPTADDLAYKAQLRDEFKKQITEEAPFVRISPYSVLRGTLGNAAIVASGPEVIAPGTSQSLDATTGSTNVQFLPMKATVADWIGRDEESLPVSCAFAPLNATIAVDSGVSSAGLRSYGVVRYGTRAYQAEIEVDIGRGTQFTVPGSAVQLQVALEPIPDGFGGEPTFAQLAGMLSFYPIVRTEPVTRTRYVDALGAGDNVTLTVPAQAKSVTFWRVPQSEPFQLDFRTVSGSVAYSVTILANANMTTPILLSPDIVAVRVTATAGAINGRLIFGLDL